MLKELYYKLHRLFSRPEEREHYSAGYWQDRIRQEALILSKDIPGRLLEVGCGEGLFLRQLAAQNTRSEIWGIDSDPTRIKQAEVYLQQNNFRNIRLSCENALNLPFESGYFDAVVCINVVFNLDSLDTVKKVLQEISRVCKRNGTVIFDFRNSANPFVKWKYKFAPVYDPTVKRLPLKTYNLEEMNLLAKGAGLEIKNKRYIGFPIKKIAPVILLEAKKI